MGQHRQHPTLAGRAMWLGLIAALVGGGCWQEIHYTGPDPATVARRRTPPNIESEPATEVAESSVDPALSEQSPPAENDLPFAESGTVSETTPAPAEVAEDLSVEEPDAPEHPGTIEDLFDETEHEPPPIAEFETPVEPPPAPEPQQPEPPDPALATRLAAWQLGSKLTLAAVANDRDLVPKDSARWFAESRTAAEKLGTSVAELPEPSTPEERTAGSRRVHDYLFQQGQRIFRDLTDRFGEDHAALFEAAVKSNVLIVLYRPGSSSIEPLAVSIRDAAPKARLPLELLQPLLDTLANQAPVAEVRVAVRKMHADVERHLSEQAEQH